MARVFTVYNCGTGFNRDRTDELIGYLGTITSGMQAKPNSVTPQDKWMICDGPGSSSKNGNPDTRTPGSGLFKKLRGNISGHGWDENVSDAMAIIKFIHAGSPISVINMAGWSRGAVTCHMLSHALASDPDTQSITVNIFAADPVAGPGNRADPRKNTIPPNVSSYFAVVAENENRSIMKPVNVGQILSDSEGLGRKVKVITVPGEHNTSVLRGTPLGKLVWFLAHKFLAKHGTELVGGLHLTHVDVCECYAGIRMYMSDFRDMHGTTGAMLGRTDRNVQNEFAQHHFWVNDHHIGQFMKAFPIMAPMITNPNLLSNGGFQLQQELQRMKANAPWTYTALVKCGLIQPPPQPGNRGNFLQQSYRG
ncbi:MAG TPA: hypothetical protein VE621_02385 [Bryobacteraceae bacterium]|nr:hypothetical protein [Bryobacteraceae bacterium]